MNRIRGPTDLQGRVFYVTNASCGQIHKSASAPRGCQTRAPPHGRRETSALLAASLELGCGQGGLLLSDLGENGSRPLPGLAWPASAPLACAASPGPSLCVCLPLHLFKNYSAGPSLSMLDTRHGMTGTNLFRPRMHGQPRPGLPLSVWLLAGKQGLGGSRTQAAPGPLPRPSICHLFLRTVQGEGESPPSCLHVSEGLRSRSAGEAGIQTLTSQPQSLSVLSRWAATCTRCSESVPI